MSRWEAGWVTAWLGIYSLGTLRANAELFKQYFNFNCSALLLQSLLRWRRRLQVERETEVEMLAYEQVHE